MSHYKPYPAYKDSGVEWLERVPEHWQVAPLKRDLSFLTSGSRGWAEHYSEIGALFLRIGNLRRESLELDLSDIQFVEVPAGAEGERTKVLAGDVLFSITAYLGSVAVVPEGFDAAYVSQHVALARIAGNFLSPNWVGYVALSWVGKTYLESQGYGGTKIQLSLDDIANMVMTVPSSKEQETAVHYLDRETARIDALIEKKTRFIELLREKRQALITHAVTKGLDPNAKMKDSGVEWLGEVPEHWEVLQLRHTARLESGHTPSRSKPEYWIDCTVPWFTLADVWQVRSGEQKYVSETSEMVSQLGLENSSARLLPAGSVFLSRTASVGFTGIMAVDMATSQDFAVWTCTSELFNEYLYYVLLGMKPDFDRLMMGSTHKTIYMPDIEAIRIARPPVDEQQGIVSVLSGQLGRFKSVIDKTERSIDLLKERRSALITAAVTGLIDLREAV